MISGGNIAVVTSKVLQSSYWLI